MARDSASASREDPDLDMYESIYGACSQNFKDVGSQVFEIGLDKFFTRILPVSDDIFPQVLSRLQDRGTLNKQGTDWLCFKNAGEPKDQSAHESAVFEPIGNLAREIVNIVRDVDSGKENHFYYDNFHAFVPESLEGYISPRPDGYFVLNTAAEDLETAHDLNKPWWRSLTLISEFSKENGAEARNENVCKVLWGMRHAMREDPGRRAIYGLTVENTTARLWFSDRSQVIVSSPFNFIVEAERLVRLLYIFLYSNPTALGWDDSMTVNGCGETKSLTYTFKVGTRKFRTSGTQVYNATISLIGRNTRVWNVCEELDGGMLSAATYVIKDTWTDADRRREGEVYDILYELPLMDEERSFLEELLLTKICHADVVVDNALDSTLDLSDIKDSYHAFDLVWRGPIEDPQPQDMDGVTPSPFYHQQGNALPTLISRGQMVHNRIVFKEFGTPLHAIDSLAQAFESIAKVATGLYILHTHGWVHRDISTSNILVCHDGTTKLVDFEYAKRFDGKTTHPMRIGTENYMAVEVDLQAYMFLGRGPSHRKQEQPIIDPPVESLLEALMRSADEDRTDTKKNTPSEVDRTPTSREAFSHNPLHDLESLHWVGINMIADRHIVGVDDGKKRPRAVYHPRLTEQHEWARKLFYNSQERLKFLYVPHHFPKFIETLDPRVQPLGHFLWNISGELVAQYGLVENDVESIDFTVGGDLYLLFKPTMVNDIDLDDFKDIRIARIDYAALKEERAKRRRLL